MENHAGKVVGEHGGVRKEEERERETIYQTREYISDIPKVVRGTVRRRASTTRSSQRWNMIGP